MNLSNDKNLYLLKNNVIFTNAKNITNCKAEYSLVENLHEYLFFILNNNIKLPLENKIEMKDFSITENLPIKKMNEFKLPDNSFFSKGNVIILYFSSKYISNPLDVLYSFSLLLNLKNTYYDIKLDFLLFKNKIVYYLFFRFSHEFKKHYSEILEHKDKIINNSKLISEKNIFSKEQREFERIELKTFPVLSSFKTNIIFEGMRYFTPLINNIKFRRSYIEND